MGLLATFFSRRSDIEIDNVIFEYISSNPESSGAQISKACKIGSARLYPALQRMEQGKRLTSRWEDMPAPRRRLYSAHSKWRSRMTEDEAIAKMKSIADGSFCSHSFDAENQHGDADEVLCEFLKSQGYTKLVEAWDDVPKWYA